MSVIAPSDPREIQEFQFKLICRLHVFDHKDEVFNGSFNLVASANKYGLLFVGYRKNVQAIPLPKVLEMEHPTDHKTSRGASHGGVEIRDYPHRDLLLPDVVTSLHLNCDQSLLAVATIKEGCVHAYFYDVASFYGPSLHLSKEIRLGACPDIHLMELSWNPGIANMLACCLSDGTVSLYEFKNGGIDINSLPPEAQTTCFSWSPKGKQLVVGSLNGTLTQYKPDLKAVKSIPPPCVFENPASVVNVLWISNFQFAAVYKDSLNESERPCLIIVNAPKSGTITFVNYEDICYSSGDLRQPQFYLLHQPNWNILVVASANSMEVGVLGLSGDHELTWEQWLQEDASRAELPLTMSKEETFPLGIALDTSTQKQLPMGENQLLPPMPVLGLLSHRGVLCLFYVVNTRPNVPVVCSPPEKMPNENVLVHFMTSSVNEPNPVLEKLTPQQQSLPNTPLSTQDWNTPSGVTSSNRVGVHINLTDKFENVGLTHNLNATKPAIVNTAQTNVELSTSQISSKFSVGDTQLLNNQGNKFTGEGQSTKHLNFSFPSSSSTRNLNLLSEEQPSCAPFQDPQSIEQNPAVGNKLPNTSLNLGDTKASPSPHNIGQSNKDEISLHTNSSNFNDEVAKQAKDIINSKVLFRAVQEEMKHFEKEMAELKARVRRLNVEVGSTEEKAKLHKKVDAMDNFCSELRETTNAQCSEIQALKNELVESLAWAEDAKSRTIQQNDPCWQQVIRSQELDPGSAQNLAHMKQLSYYVESQLVQADRSLDLQWENFQESCHDKIKRRLYIPSLEAVYQAMVLQSNILLKQKSKVKNIVEKATKHKMTKSGSLSILRSNVTNMQSRSSKDLAALAEKLLMDLKVSSSSGIAEDISEIIAAGRYSMVSSMNNKLTPEKQTILREFLTQRPVQRIRPIKQPSSSLKKLSVMDKHLKHQLHVSEHSESLKDISNNYTNNSRDIFGHIAKSVVVKFKESDAVPHGSMLFSATNGEMTFTTEATSVSGVESGTSFFGKKSSTTYTTSTTIPTAPSFFNNATSGSLLFGVSSTTATSSIMFGTATTSASGFGGGTTLFGKTNTTLTTSTTIPTTPSIFNNATSGTLMFGDPSTTVSSSTVFTTAATSASSVGCGTNLFAKTSSTSTTSTSIPTASSFFNNATLGSPMLGASSTVTTSSSMFGVTITSSGVGSGTSLFGKTSSTSTTSATVPTALSFFNNTTLGSPTFVVSSTTATSSTMFGTATTSASRFGSGTSLFEKAGTTSTTSTTVPTTPSFFNNATLGSPMFGVSSTTATPSTMFGTATTSTSGVGSGTNLFGQTSTGKPQGTTLTTPVIGVITTSSPAATSTVSTNNTLNGSLLGQVSAATPFSFGLSMSSTSSSIFGTNTASSSTLKPQTTTSTTPVIGIITTSLPTATSAVSSTNSSTGSIFGQVSATTPSLFELSSSSTTSSLTFGISTTSNTLKPQATTSTTSNELITISSPTVTSAVSTTNTSSGSMFGQVSATPPSLLELSISSTTSSSTFRTSTTSSSNTLKPQTTISTTPATEVITTSPTVTSAISTTNTSNGSIFGQDSATTPSLFGLTISSTTSSSFQPSTSIATPVFGQPTSTTTSSVFVGQGPTNTSNIFGQTTANTSSIFGQATTSTASIFGQPSTTNTTNVFGQTSSSSTNIFGQATKPTNVFGQSTTGSHSVTEASNATSLFGKPAVTSLFGQATATTSTTVFGSGSSTASVFRQPSTTSSPVFGQAVTTISSPFGNSSSSFGQSSGSFVGGGSQLTFGQSGGSIFGQNSGSGFGSSSTGSIFGGSSTFGKTGNPFQTPSKLFSSDIGAEKPGGSIFGGSSTSVGTSGGTFSAPQGQSIVESGFGSPPAFGQQNKPGGFGSPPTFGQSPGSPSTFGSSPTFGGAPTFGGSPVFGSSSRVFGSPSPSSGSVFGGGSSQQQSNTFESLASQNTMTFGNLANSQSPTFGSASGSLFGGDNTTQSQTSAFSSTPSFGGSSFSSWRS